jgi:predicted F0F1-ATPase subunit
MSGSGDRFQRGDLRENARRDIERRRRRARGPRFWHSLALIGSVGWPIVMLAVGGALLGRYLDDRWHMGVRFTLLLLTVGTAAGTAIAFHVLRGDDQ